MASKERRIISNDDGWIMNLETPVTPETIAEQMVATYPGSPVGGVSWCVGNSETFAYETEVGERFGEGREQFAEERNSWTQRNLPQPDRVIRRPDAGDHPAVPRGRASTCCLRCA